MTVTEDGEKIQQAQRGDARITRVGRVIRATSIDAQCLRKKCDDNPALGYQVMKRFLPILADRLQAARVQLVDLYAPLDQSGQAR